MLFEILPFSMGLSTRASSRRSGGAGRPDTGVMAILGSPGTDVDHPGDFSWGRSSSMGPQESMTRASAALAEWKP